MNYEKIFDTVKKAINEIDPMGLIDPDTPESFNEYEPEIKEILKKDISNLSVNDLGEWIYEVFRIYFDEKLIGTRKKYDLISEKFLEEIRK